MIKAKGQTTHKVHVDVKKLTKRLQGAYVSVGVHQGAGSYPAPPEGGKAPNVAEVALWNEFGTVYAPERSFMRSSVHEGGGMIADWRKEAIKRMHEDGWTPEKALTMIGFRVAELIRNKIKSDVDPPNAPSTQANKRRDGVAQRTLIHTGLLLRSVGYQVVVEGDEGEEVTPGEGAG